MSQAKQIISHLIKVLELVGCAKCKAEWFRLAKFDNNDVVDSFWRLLYELSIYLDTGNLDADAQDSFKQNSKEFIVTYTKQSVQNKGYYLAKFSHLPNDMSNGSRELLLALGWLISSQKIVDKYLDQTASSLESTLLPASRNVLEANQMSKSHDKLTTVQQIHQLQLQNGKVHMTLKQMYAQYKAICKLVHKVHESTQGVNTVPGRAHLSVLETYILRHPVQLKSMLKLLEQENTMLECMLLWKEHEHVFWNWMNSVLLLKLEESSTGTDSPTDHGTSDQHQQCLYYNINPQLLASLNSARNKLESAIMKNEPVIAQLEELWEYKQTEITRSDLERVHKGVTTELHNQKSHAGLKRNHQALISTLPDPVLVFSKPDSKKTNSVFIPELQGADFDQGREPMDIKFEIVSLQCEITRLELEIERKERFYRQKLDRLAANIPNAVCIQPSPVS